MFNLVADLLAWFYSLWPSYGGAIILLTLLVMVVLTPLNVKSTRSMLEMRRLQPEIKRLQAEIGNDRVKLNEEMMKLYQEHNVNPVGGCLPLFIQLPIFFVLFRLLQGLTRRSSEVGFVVGSAVGQSAATSAGPGAGGGLEAVQLPANFETFNPQYLDQGSELFADLSASTEMDFIGIDLSESASSALRESFSHGLPFLGMVILVFGLSLIQQRQIAGRNQGEIPQQQKMLMWILPFMLPVFSFAMPAGLVVYFITQSLIRIGQQAFITRRVYRPMQDREPIEAKAVEKGSSSDAVGTSAESEKPKGLLEGIMGGQQGTRPAADAARQHGRRRPTNAPPPKPKRKPPSGNRQGRTSPARSSDAAKPAKPEPTPKEGRGLFGRARRAAAEESKKTPEPKRSSSRVTPKGEQSRSNNRKKRKKR
ncbi:MAG: membrane protein insertase YidC [Acidimicrobiales bacterium]